MSKRHFCSRPAPAGRDHRRSELRGMQGNPLGQRSCGRCQRLGIRTFTRPAGCRRRAQHTHRTRYLSAALRSLATCRPTSIRLARPSLADGRRSPGCRLAAGGTGKASSTSSRTSSIQASLHQLGTRVATAAGALGLSLLLSLSPLLQPVHEAHAVTNEQLVFLEVSFFLPCIKLLLGPHMIRGPGRGGLEA